MHKEVSGAEDADTRYCQSILATVLDRNALDLEEKNDLDVAHKQRQESLKARAVSANRLARDGWTALVGSQCAVGHVVSRAATASGRSQEATARGRGGVCPAGQVPGGAEAFRQAYDTRREVLGAEHQDTALSANLLGLIANEMKDFARTEAMLKDSATIWRHKLGGSEYPEVATPVQNLAELYERQSKFAEAEEAWKIRSQAYGDQDEDTHRSLATLVRIVGKMAAAFENAGNYSTSRGNPPRAGRPDRETVWRKGLAQQTDERIMLTAVQQWAKLSDKQHAMLNLATQQLNSALQLNGQNKGAEAQPLAEKALATRETLLGDDNPVVIHAHHAHFLLARSS